MKVYIALAFFAFIAVVLAQTPSKPTWPNAFSASVMVHNNREVRPQFFRWFYDFSQQKDRGDGLLRWRDEEWFSSIIYDHVTKTEYNLFFQPNLAVCLTNALNRSIPHPTFANVQFLGKGIINYVPVNHWFERDQQRGITFQVWDTQDARRDIVRLDWDDERNHRAGSWTFFEFDRTPNNPDVYKVPAEILAQCTAVPEDLKPTNIFGY